jgi:hypothetical protein
MKINGLINNPRWKEIKCKCDHSSIETEFPITTCLHCQFQECEDSLPQEDFKALQIISDSKGNLTGTKTKTVKEITIVRGSRYEDIMGWTF